MENPRQFASLDASDIGLHGSLTNRPASAVAAGDPIDFEAISARVRYERTLPNYEYKESPGEIALRLERQAAAEQRIRAETAATNEKNRLLLERAQVQRSQLQNRISGSEVIEAEFAQTRRESPLAQIQRSTPERQPMPSTGSPPPTLNGTAARADSLVEPTATPRPAILREAIASTAGNAITALPRALPQVAGRLVIPGVGAALSIGTRLVVGQSVTQAVTSTVAGSIGYGAGFLIGTAIGGPIGGVVGAMVGSTAATLFSDWLFAQNIPSSTAHLETFIPNYPPFIGGQGVGALYSVRCTWKTTFNGSPGDNQVMNAEVYGPISDIHLEENPPEGAPGCRIVARNADGSILNRIQGNGFAPATKPYGLQITITYVSGGTQDLYVDKTVPAPPPDNSPYRYDSSPVGNDNVIPSGTPGAGKSKPESRDIAPSMPSNNTPNGARGFVGHGGLAPSYLPNPEHQASNLGGMLPAIKNAPQPLPFAEPEDIAVPRITPMLSSGEATTTATNPSTFAYPAYVPQIAQPIPISDALSPVPKAKSQPSPRTPTEAANDDIKKALDEQKKDFDDQIKRLTAIATGLAALTPAIQGIPDAIANNPNVRAANRDDVQGAVCEIAQPTGCLGAPIKQAEDAAKANGNKLNDILTGLNTAGSAAQLALLETINGKLGAQLPGGLSGTFGRLWETLQIDRILNILILITTFHNASMLSSNILQTLFSGIDNLGQAAGFKWKNEEGNEVGFGGIISEWTSNFFKGIFGVTTLQNVNATWNAANRTYQSVTNALWNIQGMFDSARSITELIVNNTGKIGNALKRGGAIFEDAFPDMSEKTTARTAQQAKWDAVLENAQPIENAVSAFSQVTGDIVNIGDSFNQLKQQKTEFEESKKAGEDAIKALVTGEKDAAKVNQPINSTDVQKNDD